MHSPNSSEQPPASKPAPSNMDCGANANDFVDNQIPENLEQEEEKEAPSTSPIGFQTPSRPSNPMFEETNESFVSLSSENREQPTPPPTSPQSVSEKTTFAEKLYACLTCRMRFRTGEKLFGHNNTKFHVRRVEGIITMYS